MAVAYARLLVAQARSQAQYRTSFAFDLAGSFLFAFVDLFGVVALFQVTRRLGGFDLLTSMMMASASACGFALADLAVGSIERMRLYVRSGLLDTVLVRVTTDDGLVGWGEAYGSIWPAVVAAIDGWIAPLVIGKQVDDETAIDLQHIPAQAYLDGQISFKPDVGDGQVEMFLNVRNILDNDPPINPSAGNIPVAVNTTLHDSFGRLFRAGVRFKF